MEQKLISYSLLGPISSLEEFLKDYLNISRSKLKKYLKKDQLTRSFAKGAVLKLPLNLLNEGMISPVYQGDEIRIVDENELFLVFEKNPNQFIHPLTYDESDNCLSFFRSIGRSDILEVNREQYDRGLLYRLDYETSGVVIYAKSDVIYQNIRENFSTMAKRKTYLAWTSGKVKDQARLLHSFSSKGEGGKQVVVAEAGVHEVVGELAYALLEYDKEKDMSLVEVELKTGLRHQIRAQMAHVGHPLIGDVFYGGRTSDRLYLHAKAYQITYSGKDFSWEAKPYHFKPLD